MTKNMLFLSLAAAAFAANLDAAAAQGVPTLDVNTLCRAEAKAASEFSQNCLGDQKQAHEELVLDLVGAFQEAPGGERDQEADDGGEQEQRRELAAADQRVGLLG